MNTDAMRSAQEEISEYRRQLQARTIEIEGLRGANESLERQILELEERHSAEVATYQVKVGALRREESSVLSSAYFSHGWGSRNQGEDKGVDGRRPAQRHWQTKSPGASLANFRGLDALFSCLSLASLSEPF